MKIITIASNINGNIDGIGKHARILTEEYKKRGHEASIIDGTTHNKSGLQKALSFQMSKCIFKACWVALKSKPDVIIYEYPFAEFNPLIIIPVFLLWLITRFSKTKVAISMHEFDRVNILRKSIICVFLVFTDIVYVSEKKYIDRFTLISKKMYVRTIPNHIEKPAGEKIIDKTRYTYFGLINRAKAFQEMIDAWNDFNKDNKYQLDVMTCSDVSQWKDNNHNVIFHHDLPGEEVAKILYDSAFTIIPVLPNIGLNNSSFMSGIQCGCVPLGIFNELLQKEDYVVNMQNYNHDHFVKTLNDTQSIAEKDIQIMSASGLAFGSKFSVKHTVDQMLAPLL